MWIFLNNAFVSAVEHNSNPELLVVRARAAGDLERFFDEPALKVEMHPERDYLYRTIVTKERFAQQVAQHAAGIDYPNFKGSIGMKSHLGFERHEAYLDVWSAMHSFQTRLKKFKSKAEV